MSEERELLKKITVQLSIFDLKKASALIEEIQELLAQPDINTQYLLDQVARLTVENAMLKEKWLAPPKREPLSDKEIHAYLSMIEPPFLWDEGFCSGVEWAEKQHGIGGGK